MAKSMLDPLRSLARMEWVFIGLIWLTVWYFFFNVFDTLDRSVSFDSMPIIAGALAIPVLWWALRIGDQVKVAVDRLSDGAGLEPVSDQEWEAFERSLNARVRSWTIGVATLIAIVMLLVFAYSIGVQGLKRELGVAMVLQVLLGMILSGAGVLVGMTLGRLVGYGHLGRIMEQHRIQVISLGTPASREAMRGLEGVFRFAVFTCMALCLWFAAWWAMWHAGLDQSPIAQDLGLDGYRRGNQWPFLALWIISLTIFVFAGRQPVRAFHRRLDAIYGGTEARDALDRQLAEALEDLRTLAARPDGGREKVERGELEAFVVDLKARQFRSWLLNPRLMDALLGLNLALMLLPWLFGDKIPFVLSFS